MPEFEKIDVIKSTSETTPGMWIVMATIDRSLKKTSESLLAAYGAQLEKAGFALDDVMPGSVQAENDWWTITYHSSMDGTLTIGTVPK